MTANPFTYPEVGATQQPPLPAGYRHLSYLVRLPDSAMLSQAGEAVMTWQMHRGAGVRIDASATRAAPGVQVTSRLGLGRWRLSAPCQVVWTVAEPDRVGFGYGTLPGHPAHGEESFVVSQDQAGALWLAITSFSRPASWFMRAAGPAAPLLQQAFARRCGRSLARLSRQPRPARDWRRFGRSVRNRVR